MNTVVAVPIFADSEYAPAYTHPACNTPRTMRGRSRPGAERHGRGVLANGNAAMYHPRARSIDIAR